MFVRISIGLAALFIVCSGALVHMTQVVDGDQPGQPKILDERETRLAEDLEDSVRHQTDVIGHRNGTRAGSLTQAEEYLAGQLRGQDLTVTREEFKADGLSVANLVVEITGASRPGEIIVIGAHYDSYGRSPSANASASGSAVMVELAGQIAGQRLSRTVRLVLFTTGEYPYYGTAQSGAVVHANNAKAKGQNIKAAVMLGSLGCWATRPGTQKFPFPMSLCYPDTGDFLAVFGERDLVKDVGAGLLSTGSLRVRGGTLPDWMPGMQVRGDQDAFEQAGFPTVLVTDTGSSRDPHLRTSADGSQRVDFVQLARVTSALTATICNLANAAD
jgi:Zn-dependent M28 family amino/carboxypeptidase